MVIAVLAIGSKLDLLGDRRLTHAASAISPLHPLAKKDVELTLAKIHEEFDDLERAIIAKRDYALLLLMAWTALAVSRSAECAGVTSSLTARPW